MIKQSCYALMLGGAAMTSLAAYAAGEGNSSAYQQSESVSSTVYSSQDSESALAAEPEIKLVPKANVQTSAVKPKGQAEQVVSVSQSTSKVVSPVSKEQSVATTPSLAAEPKKKAEDKSLLAFIDDWLGIKPVKPWQKGTLAKQEMKPGGLVPEFDVFSEKVFSYKQGSVGGNGVGGGGCGCN